MTEEEFLKALTEVDLSLESYPGWMQIKDISFDYPLYDDDEMSPGQQAVFVFWRCIFVDSEGNTKAPTDLVETPASVVVESLGEFRALMAELLLSGDELDLENIRSLFEMAQTTLAD